MIGPELNFTPRGLYIGGEWQEAAEGGRLASINPSTGEPLGEVPAATGADVDRAVRAARKAFESEWRRMPILERAACLERLAARLLAHRDELGLMDCVDAGNALSGMVGDVDWTVDTLRYFAGLVTEIKGETSSYGPRHLNFTRRQPYGVVAKINAFNHPFRFCAEKAAAALAAGNTVVVKAADQAPLSSLRFAELCEGDHAAGGGERGHRRWRDRLGHGAASAGGAHRLRGLGGDRAHHRPRGGGRIEGGDAGARRQEPHHHLPRRRPGEGREERR